MQEEEAVMQLERATTVLQAKFEQVRNTQQGDDEQKNENLIAQDKQSDGGEYILSSSLSPSVVTSGIKEDVQKSTTIPSDREDMKDFLIRGKGQSKLAEITMAIADAMERSTQYAREHPDDPGKFLLQVVSEQQKELDKLEHAVALFDPYEDESEDENHHETKDKSPIAAESHHGHPPAHARDSCKTTQRGISLEEEEKNQHLTGASALIPNGGQQGMAMSLSRSQSDRIKDEHESFLPSDEREINVSMYQFLAGAKNVVAVMKKEDNEENKKTSSNTSTSASNKDEPNNVVFGGDAFLSNLAQVTQSAIDRSFKHEEDRQDRSEPDPLQEDRQRLLESFHELLSCFPGSESSKETEDSKDSEQPHRYHVRFAFRAVCA